MVHISALIITYNEEKNIGRCIDSVTDIVDDVVIVDSYSTDNTEKICKSKGVRFVQHKFRSHIDQKNWAISQAKYPLVLSLDADEALDDAAKESIREIKKNWQYDGYIIKRLTNYCGKWIRHCGWYPDKKLRLWDSRKGSWAGINPHDRFELKESNKIGHLEGNILHYSYYSITDHINQVNYFTDIAADAYLAEGKKSSLLKILFSPLIKFIQGYFIKRGFLDGFYGLVICVISSHATFIKYVKIKQRGSKKS